MATFQKARSQRVYFGDKSKEQRKKNRGETLKFSKSDARIISSPGYFRIMAFHAMFLHRAFGVDPKKFLGESNIIKRLKG